MVEGCFEGSKCKKRVMKAIWNAQKCQIRYIEFKTAYFEEKTSYLRLEGGFEPQKSILQCILRQKSVLKAVLKAQSAKIVS